MLLPPREVVVVVHLVHRLGAEDLEHLGDHDVAAGVRVLAGQLHRGDVRVAELRADLEQHRRRVHLALVRPRVERAGPARARGSPRRSCGRSRASRSARRPRSGRPRPPSGSRSGCPSRPCRAATRPAARACAAARSPRCGSGRAPGGRSARPPGTPMPNEIRRVISRMTASTPPSASRSAARQLRPRGLVAAADVVADARRRDVALVGDAAADRLAVARVVVGAEHAELGVAGLHAPLELLRLRSSTAPNVLIVLIAPPF